MSVSFTCPRCGATSHHPRDVQEGYCGACRDWTRGETVPAGSGIVTRAQQDWGPEIHPDHYPYEGCCEIPADEHPLTPAEASAVNAWMETEPGMRERLARREARYARLAELDAGPVILAYARKAVNDMRRKLGEPVMDGEELELGSQPDE
jgi:hypothetical protein